MRRGLFQKTGKLVVGRTDVKAHYQEIDIDIAAEEVRKEMEESGIDIDVDTYELALYLACTVKPEDNRFSTQEEV